jgi:hypothetical protein
MQVKDKSRIIERPLQVKSVETGKYLNFTRVRLSRNMEKRKMSTFHEERMEQHREGGNQCHIAFQITAGKNEYRT